MKTLNMREALRSALTEEMERDPTVVYMGEDVGIGGILDLTMGLTDRFGAHRIIPTPISEAGFIGAALGMALAGMRPIAEIMWADLSLCAADPIINGAAKMHYKSGGLATAPMVICTVQGGGVGHGNNQSQCMESLYGTLPGLKIVMPSSPYDAKGLFKSAIRDPNPVLFISPKRDLLSMRKGDVFRQDEIPDEELLIPIGQAESKRAGRDVTVVCWGSMVPAAMLAADELEPAGISIEVVDLRSLIPMDMDAIYASVEKTGRLVTAHEGHRHLGFGAEIAARVQERLWGHLKAPIGRVAALDVPIPFSRDLELAVLPTKDSIVAAVRRTLD